MDQQQQARIEALGPAETIVATLINFTDHMVHNRTGMVTPDPQGALGVRWQPVICCSRETPESKVIVLGAPP